jgi:hypothetical protein
VAQKCHAVFDCCEAIGTGVELGTPKPSPDRWIPLRLDKLDVEQMDSRNTRVLK